MGDWSETKYSIDSIICMSEGIVNTEGLTAEPGFIPSNGTPTCWRRKTEFYTVHLDYTGARIQTVECNDWLVNLVID